MIRPFAPGLSTDTQGDEVSGPEMEEVVAIAKMIEGSADIIQMKDAGGATNHPNSFSMEKDQPWMLSPASHERSLTADVFFIAALGE